MGGMDFRHQLPAMIYQQATELHPYRFVGRVRAARNLVQIDRKFSLVLHSSCGRLTRLAARQLIATLHATFGVRLRRRNPGNGRCIFVRCDQSSLAKPESYHQQNTPDRIDISARDDEAGMRALFHMERQMLNQRAPVLPLGRRERAPRWSLRITSPLRHQPRDPPADYCQYPHAYLLNMARYGYNASFLCLNLLEYLSPSVAGPLAQAGWRKRLGQLNRAVDRWARYGIRLLFHVNLVALAENHPAFRKQPALRGAVTWQPGLRCLCSSSPRVLRLLQDGAHELFSNVPALAGAVLITGGECFLHCFSRPHPRPQAGTNCPRCSRVGPVKAIAGAVNAFARGAMAAQGQAEIFAWAYSGFVWGSNRTQARVIEGLDRRVSVLESFEKDDWLRVGGVRSYVFDYSIRHLGPAPRFGRLAKVARKRGLKVYARTESSQCIEMLTVPRIPIMQRWAQRFARLREAGVDGVHTAWRFYGFCGQRTDEIVDHFAWEPRPNANRLLRQMAQRDFGLKAAERVLAAWQKFSRAFAHFPYSAAVSGFPYFRGPFYLGPAHPFVFDLTSSIGLSQEFYAVDPSMAEGLSDAKLLEQTRQPRFFVDLTWTQPFGPEKIAGALSRLWRGWDAGLAELRSIRRSRGRGDVQLQRELDVAAAIGCMIHTANNLLRFQRLRAAVTAEPCTPVKLRRTCLAAVEVLKDELANAETALQIVRRDASVGFGSYEPSFTVDLIEEKIEHTRRQIENGVAGFYANYAFHIFASSRPL